MLAALLLVACVLSVTACSDSPPNPRLQRSSAALPNSPNGAPPSPGPVIPICPAAGDLPSPFPPGLPPSPTVAAGTIAGSFSVSRTGEAGYSIPLLVPPGRAGMEPSLEVTYDSASGEGVLGMGFSLSGLSAITRCPRNEAQDGETRAVQDDTSDELCLDGMRLIRTVIAIDSPPVFTQEYRTFPDTFTKVVSDFGAAEGWDATRGPKSLKAFTKAGTIVEYGSSPTGQVLAKNGSIRSWLVTRVSDRFGNTIDTTYLNDKHPGDGYTVEHAPLRIDYTGHPDVAASRAVAFEYERLEAAGTRVLFSRGMQLKRSLRLDRVAMLGPGDSLVREYRFSYGAGPATGRALLEEIEECAADQTCKPPTRFAWHHGGSPGFVETTTVVEAPESDLGSVMMMDITGDGLDDLVMSDVDMTGGSELPVTNWLVSLNLGPDQGPAFFDASTLAHQESHYEPPSPIQPDLGTPMDYDQDGLTDILLHDVHGELQHWNVLIAEPDHTFSLHDTGIGRPFLLSTMPPPRLKDAGASAHRADVNGDGVADLIQCLHNGTDWSWSLHLWTPGAMGFDPAPTAIAELSPYRCDEEMHTVDVDADGKVDLLVRGAIVTSNGAQFFDEYHALTYVGHGVWRRTGTDLERPLQGERVIFLDVNGDGLPDAVKSDTSNQLSTFINTGAGFLPSVSSLPPGILEADAFVKLATPIDYNADGRQDLLMPMPNPGGIPSWVLLESTGTIGDGTFAIVSPSIPFDAQFLDTQITLADPRGPRVTDLDGDGVQDVVLAVGGFIHTFKNTLGEEDLLASVTDGLNALDPGDPGFLPNVQISYAHLVDLATTAGLPADSPAGEAMTYLPRYDGQECTYPVRCVVGPRRVVSDYVLNNGADRARHFQVAYRNGRFHRLGRGFLGFGARIIRDLDTGAGTAEFYDNVTFNPGLDTFPYAGEVVRSWRWNPTLPLDPLPGEVPIELLYTSALLQTEKTLGGMTYFTVPVLRRERREQGAFTPGGPLTVEQYVRATEVNPAVVLGNSTKAIADIDDHGNVLSESTATEGVDLQLSVTRQVENDVDAWLLGQVTAQTECSTAAGITQCRTTTRTYDAAGQVHTESAGSDDGDPESQVSLTFGRDDFGNIAWTMADDAFGHHRGACTSYDAEGIFPYAHKNPAGHVSFTRFDPGLGVQTAAVDPNLLATRWAHDGFARVTQELRADGTATTYSRTRTKDAGPLQNQWNIKLRTVTGGLGDDTVQYDSLGRPIRWWTQGVRPAGAPPAPRIMQWIAFDELGEHVARRSIPASELTPPVLVRADRYEFDGLGRVVKHVSPWDAVTTYRYVGTRVVIEAPGGVTTAIDNDALGRPVTVVDAEGGLTSYSYGPFGGLWTVTGPGGAENVTVRDAYGRVRVHNDPDRGETIAHYNGFGQRTSSIDAQGRETSLEYDPLGRLTSRVDVNTGGVTSWKWDGGAHGIGQLAQVTSPDGHEVSYAYDPFGRLQTKRLAIDGETFASTLSYDPHGRLETIAYPQGDGVAPFVVRQAYDPHGHLIGVRDEATSFPYWQATAADGAGRILSEAFGTGGVTTTRGYAEARDRVQSIVTTAGATTLQHLSYYYDDRQNLSARTDARQGRTEYFEYDHLDRLRCARFNILPGCMEEQTYDANGNITFKPGVGAYTYDPVQPHAVKTAGPDSFSYDATGNQIARPGATISYTAFDLPETFTLDQGGTIALDYDGHQARIRKTTPEEETVYFGDLYERVTHTTTGLVEHRYHVRSSERVVAVVTQTQGEPTRSVYVHVDHLGSIDVLTDAAGVEIDRHSYDAFGARRNPLWGAPAPAPFPASPITPGFTGHASDDELGLVNMKGRIYDPKVGRFLTPDPIIGRPWFSQSWNAYSYVLNNPLAYVDPSGFQPAEKSEEDKASPPQANIVTPEGDPITVEVRGRRVPRSQATEGPRESAEARASPVPADVDVYGETAGVVPAPEPAGPEESTLRQAGKVYVGAVIGLNVLALKIAESAVLNALTFGGYGTYKNAEAIWPGYQDDGILGALNALNPLAHIAMGAVGTYQAADNGDHMAAGATGAITGVLAVATVLGAAQGMGALAGEAAAAAAEARAAAAGARGAARAYSVAFETTIPKVGAGTRPGHFGAANKALLEEMRASPELTQAIRRLGIEIPTNASGAVKGVSPSGWTWHHVPDRPGVLQLVPRGQHTAGSGFYGLMHPDGRGGFFLWGAEF